MHEALLLQYHKLKLTYPSIWHVSIYATNLWDYCFLYNMGLVLIKN